LLPKTALEHIRLLERLIHHLPRVGTCLGAIHARLAGTGGLDCFMPGQLNKLGAIVFPQLLDAHQYFQEFTGRVIERRIERMAIRGHKRIERPPAYPAGFLDKLNQARVQRRIELAIDFHRNEMGIEKLRNLGIPITFALHHMTPMTGEIADRNVQELAFLARARDGFGIPLLPGDRIGAVQGQIR
jgi:hypothetical protein